MIVGRDSFSPWTWARFQTGGAQPLWRMSLYIFDILFLSPYMCNNFYGLSTSVGCWSSAFTRRIIYKFLNVCPFDYTAFAVSEKVGIP